MTLTNTTVRQRFNCNGVTTDFAIPFAFQANSEIKVYLRDESVSPATETLQVLTTDYTLVGGPPVTTVRMNSAPASTKKLLLIRVTAKTQATDYTQNDGFPAASHEDALDKLAQMIQELSEMIDRSALLPVTSTLTGVDLPDPTAYQYLRWNSGATNLEGKAITATAPITWTDATGVIAIPRAATAADGYLHQDDWNTFNNKQVAGSPSISATELGYLDGATSNIQAQINAIVGSAIGFTVYNSIGSPASITAAGGVTPSSDQKQLRFIQGNAVGVDITANPQVAAGVTIGQELRLVGCSDSLTVKFDHGTGLKLNGSWIARAGSVLDLFWDGTDWCESGRNSI